MGANRSNSSYKLNRGATLVEVLIVVAVVAILAAIASANYQEVVAQAKSAKVVSDHRTIFGALQMSHIDQGRFPAMVPGISDLELKSLTTPISYMSSLPDDPFGSVSITETQYPDGGYDYLRYQQLDYPFDILLIDFWFQSSAQSHIALISTGPNGKQEMDFRAPGILNYRLSFTEYDPSNGTISAGDIYTTSQPNR